jgi:hypothetical protein
MKTIYLTLVLLVPLMACAQEHLLGKTTEQVRTTQDEANIPATACNYISKSYRLFDRGPKFYYYDVFHCGNEFDLFCYYKNDTCVSVAARRNINAVDSMRRQLNLNAVKVKKNLWTNKEGTVNIKLTAYKKYNEFYLKYWMVSKH